MPQAAPLVLHLYDQEGEIAKTCTRTFIPWKMLKKAVALHKQFGSKKPDEYEESDIDALTGYVIAMFDGQGLTVERLDEQSDVSEMVILIKSVVSRAKGIMDPTLPPNKT
jgi:hypothetical protein